MKTTRRTFLNRLALAGLATGSGTAFACSGNSTGVKGDEAIRVFDEADICVLGGSCTGVFAAIRAARLGAKVVIVEKQNAFGGVATSSLVNIWHSLLDTEFKQQIIAGMTVEVLDRLRKRGAVNNSEKSESVGFTFNSQELKIELDELIMEAGVKPYFHTLFSEPYLVEGKLAGVWVDCKSGRGLIKANYFIDATGDGDLCTRLGLETYTSGLLQPPTTCAHLDGLDMNELEKLLKEHGKEFNIPDGFVWGSNLPSTQTSMLAGTRVYGKDCCDVYDLTAAEMEGRRQIRAIMDLVRKYGKLPIGLNGLPSYIGIRETRHIKCLYQVSDEDTLHGKRIEDAIANGSYRLDIHHQDKPGLTFRYLDGTEIYSRPGYPGEKKRWRPETATNPTFYQIPLRSIIPQNTENVILAGRMFDAGIIAFSGMRVMVNMNQLGEAAGVTAYLALNKNAQIKDIPFKEVRQTLEAGGSIII